MKTNFFKYNQYFQDKNKYPCIEKWAALNAMIEKYVNDLVAEANKYDVPDPKPWQTIRIKEIRKQVEQLSKHLQSYETYLEKMGNNLGTTVNMYNTAYKEFGKIDKDVMKITESESKIEVMQIDKPKMEE